MEFTFEFVVRGNITIGVESGDEGEAKGIATEALEAISLGNSIYPVVGYTIELEPDLALESVTGGEEQRGG